MKFIDEAKIEVIAGNGGNGIASFCREKFRPFGGPNGGDGGKGGSILAIADRNINTLVHYHYTALYKAHNGENGRSADCYGKKAKDIYLPMPIGTLITNIDTKKRIVDFTTHNEVVLLAKGGEGGLGNIHFKNSINRVPRQKTNGKVGEHFKLHLELNILADVGLLGTPNAGKSTFITAVSNARPKIADYPFTTLNPQLGLVRINYEHSFIIADIPGLIKGAAAGIGLGVQFLRHLQRTNLLLHIIDFSLFNSSTTLVLETQAIIEELKVYDNSLFKKPRWLILNKIDLIPKNKRKKYMQDFLKQLNWQGQMFAISAFTHENCKNLIIKICDYLNNKR